jgi:hypothetical protein
MKTTLILAAALLPCLVQAAPISGPLAERVMAALKSSSAFQEKDEDAVGNRFARIRVQDVVCQNLKVTGNEGGWKCTMLDTTWAEELTLHRAQAGALVAAAKEAGIKSHIRFRSFTRVLRFQSLHCEENFQALKKQPITRCLF